jgi:hypothetical protein
MQISSAEPITVQITPKAPHAGFETPTEYTEGHGGSNAVRRAWLVAKVIKAIYAIMHFLAQVSDWFSWFP